MAVGSLPASHGPSEQAHTNRSYLLRLQLDLSYKFKRIKAMRDGTLLGAGFDQSMWVRRGALAPRAGGWVQIPNSCCIVDMDELADGRIIGIGNDPGSLWVTSLSGNSITGWQMIWGLTVSINAIATPTGEGRSCLLAAWSCW
jgi:hypothetical protein